MKGPFPIQLPSASGCAPLKEKVAVGPAGVAPGVGELHDHAYGGRAFANVLATRGLVVVAHDVFTWGSRRFNLGVEDIGGYNNRSDHLFTPPGMAAADEQLRAMAAAAGHPNRYTAEWYEGGHKFDRPMQDAAFTWLADVLRT